MQKINAIEKADPRKTYKSVDELAAVLGISRATAYNGLRSGAIPSIKLGKRFVVPHAAIAEWLRNAGGNIAA